METKALPDVCLLTGDLPQLVRGTWHCPLMSEGARSTGRKVSRIRHLLHRSVCSAEKGTQKNF